MSRNRFQEILSNLYLDDNTQIAKDRYYKVRVLFEKLNFHFKPCGSFANQVDADLPDIVLTQGADVVLV